jgi:hypothetical protein
MATLRDSWNELTIKLKLRSYKSGNAFCTSVAAFYDTLLAGRSPVEDGAAGLAVVEFCEETVRAIAAPVFREEVI